MKVKTGLFFKDCRRPPPSQFVFGRHTLTNLFLSAKKDRCGGKKRILFGHDSEANWRWSLQRLSSKCLEGRRRVRKRKSNAWNMCFADAMFGGLLCFYSLEGYQLLTPSCELSSPFRSYSCRTEPFGRRFAASITNDVNIPIEPLFSSEWFADL